MKRGRPLYKDNDCLEGFILSKKLGSGTFGTVYMATRINDNTIYAVKRQNFNKVVVSKKIDLDDWKKEAKNATRFSVEWGIGPRIVATCLNLEKGYGYIIAEKWDRALKWGDKLPSNLLQKLKLQVNKLHENGIVHADVWPRNVLVRLRLGKVVDVTLNDFGGAMPKEELLIHTDLLEQLVEMCKDDAPEYYAAKNLSYGKIKNNVYLLDYAMIWQYEHHHPIQTCIECDKLAKSVCKVCLSAPVCGTDCWKIVRTTHACE